MDLNSAKVKVYWDKQKNEVTELNQDNQEVFYQVIIFWFWVIISLPKPPESQAVSSCH